MRCYGGADQHELSADQIAMYVKKMVTFALLLISLVLFAVQGGFWARSTTNARSETDKQNMESRHPPNEIPGIAAVFLLIAAGVLASVPRRSRARRSQI